MKKLKKQVQLIIMLLFVITFYNCKAQSQLQRVNTYNIEILGNWISVDDSTYKIEFSSSGIQKEYINNELQDDTYNYIISTSCGTNTNNSYDIYLKRVDNDEDYVCEVINNISEDENGILTLSITTERGKLELYKKL